MNCFVEHQELEISQKTVGHLGPATIAFKLPTPHRAVRLAQRMVISNNSINSGNDMRSCDLQIGSIVEPQGGKNVTFRIYRATT
jgi:hypothetical protein